MLELAQHAERLRREGLVQLPEVDLLALRSPACASAFSHAGHGPMPMIEGSTPAAAQARMRASGFKPRALGRCIAHHHQRRRAVVDARGVARRDRAVLLERRPQARRASRPSCRRAGTRRRANSTVSPFFLPGIVDRARSRRGTFPPPAPPPPWPGSRPRTRPAPAREISYFFGDVLGRDAHVHVRDRAGEAVGDHRVEQLAVTEAVAVARLGEEVGRVATCSPCRPRRPRRTRRARSPAAAFATAFRPEPHALLIAVAGDLLRDARLEIGDARRVQTETCGEHVARG